MVYFLLLILFIVYFSFSDCFRCKVRMYVWDFFFVSWDMIVLLIIFPPRTAFSVSHGVLILCFNFHLSLGIFLFPLWFFEWSIDCLLSYCLASTCLKVLQFFISFLFFFFFSLFCRELVRETLPVTRSGFKELARKGIRTSGTAPHAKASGPPGVSQDCPTIQSQAFVLSSSDTWRSSMFPKS